MAAEPLAETFPARGLAHRYRDELNFAEFPIATVADTVAEDVKTLDFTDQIFDPSTGKPVTRTLTITAADKFGLPTALDDEVLLGLIQLSCDRGFADRKVHFSRYELIKLLGWRDESKSYKRIEESLNRWTGVTLQYQKAWWSKEEQCWVNETFHVIDQVTVFDRERLERRRRMAKDSPAKALSSFLWNEAVFQSFQAGYIKSLDFDFYKSLRSAISKRMFRFLDKRFYHKEQWEFDLRAFACEHIGLSKKYSNSELKRKLLPAVKELEEQAFLVPVPPEERFTQVRVGRWQAQFAKATKKATVRPRAEGERSLVAELVARGLTRRSAQKLVSQHAESYLRAKITLLDSLRTRGGAGAIRNRAGWLYAAIVDDYSAPEDESSKTRTRSAPASAPTPAPGGKGADDAVRPEVVAFAAHWAQLTEAQRVEYEAEAVAAAPAFLRNQYAAGKDAPGTLWRVTREQILVHHHVRRSRS